MTDKLEKLKEIARNARDLEYQRQDLLAQAKEISAKLQLLYTNDLPTLFDEIGTDHFSLVAEGNLPTIDYELHPYYSASISSKWPPKKQEEAFALLKRCKAEELIKTEVSARLPKGKLQVAKKLVAAAKKLKVTADIKLSVHKGTLCAWLRELYEDRHQSLSQLDLEKIGGSVGRIVRPKGRKDEDE